MSILDDPSAWDDWFHAEIKPIIDPAWFEASQAVEVCLQGLRDATEATEGVHRDHWVVFAPSPIKSAARVRTKLLADGACEDVDLPGRVFALPDLARLRIVGTLKRDVAHCRHTVLSSDGATFLGRYAIRDLKDFVRDEKLRRPLLGHRALQLVVQVPSGERTVHVEVQLMTLLQHVWDRRNHAMYEWLREHRNSGSLEIDELRVDDHAVAEALPVIDALADHNYATFLKLRSGA